MAVDKTNDVGNFIVDGYQFTSEEDAKKAAIDISKIKLLEARVKVSKPNDVKAVYEKAIENKIFKTFIGWEYLMDLRKKLVKAGFDESELIPLPVNISFTKHSALDNLQVKQRIKPEKKKVKSFVIFSLVLNVFLVILVVIMFVIALRSDTDNMLNYKSNVTNRYAAWEDDLKEREKKVREAEKRLGIEDTSSYYDGTYDN